MRSEPSSEVTPHVGALGVLGALRGLGGWTGSSEGSKGDEPPSEADPECKSTLEELNCDLRSRSSRRRLAVPVSPDFDLTDSSSVST